MNTFKTSKLVCAAAVMLAGFAGYGAFGQSENPTATVGQGSNPYIGTYFAKAMATNGPGGYTITPPTNTTTCTFKDASGFPSPYSSSIVVMRSSDLHAWHTNNNNSVTFPVTNSTTYTMAVYVNSTPPPPTNGQPMTLQIQWH